MTLPAPLIDHLCRRRQAITKAWLLAILGSPEVNVPANISAPQLLDHLPKLFDELADYLRGAGKPQAEDDARTHGRCRWEQHFRLDAVLRELLVMRGLIFDEIECYVGERYVGEQDAHAPSASDIILEARRRVGRFFDEVLFYSASQFSEQQQAQIEADRRLIARQHETAHAELQAQDAARLRMLRTIAHELRNMLNAAALSVENLSAEEDPAWRAQQHEMLGRNHRQMTALVNQLLEVAPLLAGRESLRLAPLEVQTFCAEQRKLFERMAASKRLQFRCDVAEPLPEVVTDEIKLQRIITNLVQNALKYTPAGGSVELRFEPLDAERWRLRVSDTGRGIPEAHRAKIFEEFHRVPGTEQQEGTGLGLSIVRQLVALFRGEVTVESRVGRGTTFCVTLPRDPGKVA